MSRSPQSRASAARLELEETETAFAHVRASLIDRLVKATPTDTAFMQAMVVSIQNLDAVREQLHDIVSAGAVEDLRDELNARSDT